MAIPATRSVRNIPTHVALDTDDGMSEPCALSVDNAFPARKAMLVHQITTLTEAKMRDVCGALDVATGCRTDAR